MTTTMTASLDIATPGAPPQPCIVCGAARHCEWCPVPVVIGIETVDGIRTINPRRMFRGHMIRGWARTNTGPGGQRAIGGGRFLTAIRIKLDSVALSHVIVLVQTDGRF